MLGLCKLLSANEWIIADESMIIGVVAAAAWPFTFPFLAFHHTNIPT